MGLPIAHRLCAHRTPEGPRWHRAAVFGAGVARRRAMLAGHRGQAPGPLWLRLPPHDAVADVVGFRTGNAALAVARPWGGHPRHGNGAPLWARGEAVSTVGWEEEPMRRDIRNQEQLDAPGREEDGDFSESLGTFIWQPLGLLATVKPPALPERHDSPHDGDTRRHPPQ